MAVCLSIDLYIYIHVLLHLTLFNIFINEILPEMLLALTSCAQSSITDWGTSSKVSF